MAASLRLAPEAAGAFALRSGTALPCRVGETGTPLLVDDLDQTRVSSPLGRLSLPHALSASPTPLTVDAPHRRQLLASYADRRNCYAAGPGPAPQPRRPTQRDHRLRRHRGQDEAHRRTAREHQQARPRPPRQRPAGGLVAAHLWASRRARRWPTTTAAAPTGTSTSPPTRSPRPPTNSRSPSPRCASTTTSTTTSTRPARMRRRLSAAGMDDELAYRPPRAQAVHLRGACRGFCRQKASNILKRGDTHAATLHAAGQGRTGAHLPASPTTGVGIEVHELASTAPSVHIGLQVVRGRRAQVDSQLSVLTIEQAEARIAATGCRPRRG